MMRKYTMIIVVMLAGVYVAPVVAANFGGAVSFVSGGAASSYLYEEKYEGVGMPSGHSYVDSTGTAKLDFDDTTPTMEGSESVYFPDPGTASNQNKLHIEPGADVDELYFSLMVNWSDSVDYGSVAASFRLSDTVDADVVQIEVNPSGNIVGSQTGGSDTSAACTTVINTDYWVKIRAKKGTGADAEIALWCTSSTTSWGTSVTSSNGTWTTQLDYIELNNYSPHDTSWNYDHVIVDTTDIPISAYQ